MSLDPCFPWSLTSVFSLDLHDVVSLFHLKNELFIGAAAEEASKASKDSDIPIFLRSYHHNLILHMCLEIEFVPNKITKIELFI